MKAKKYTKAKQQKKTSAEKPASVYGNKSITFFNSLEEENEYTFMMRARLLPLENFQHAVLFIKRIFPNPLKRKIKKNIRLHFD